LGPGLDAPKPKTMARLKEMFPQASLPAAISLRPLDPIN
jgi:hypothetical protein